MVSVAHHTDGAGFHHHIEIEVHWILKPSFGESAENVPMSDLEFNQHMEETKARCGRIIVNTNRISPALRPCMCGS